MRFRGLTIANPNSRENVSTLLEAGLRPKGFFVNDFIQASLFLEEISLKDSHEKDQFLKLVLISFICLFIKTICQKIK